VRGRSSASSAIMPWYGTSAMLIANMQSTNPLKYSAPLLLSRTLWHIMHRLTKTKMLARRNSGSRRPIELAQLSQSLPITGSQNFEAPYTMTQMPSM
jgi:hypothetical protein